MAISRARKEELVAQYMELIAKSEAIFLTEYTGMNVKSLEGLRQKVYDADGALYVTKNTLLRHALQESNKPVADDLFVGQVATGFALGEVPAMAKALADFAKAEEHLKLLGGVLGNKVLSAEDVESLAKLPSLDQLRAQLVGLINAPAQSIASAVANGVRQVINVIDAYAKSEEGETAEVAA